MCDLSCIFCWSHLLTEKAVWKRRFMIRKCKSKLWHGDIMGHVRFERTLGSDIVIRLWTTTKKWARYRVRFAWYDELDVCKVKTEVKTRSCQSWPCARYLVRKEVWRQIVWWCVKCARCGRHSPVNLDPHPPQRNKNSWQPIWWSSAERSRYLAGGDDHTCQADVLCFHQMYSWKCAMSTITTIGHRKSEQVIITSKMEFFSEAA